MTAAPRNYKEKWQSTLELGHFPIVTNKTKTLVDKHKRTCITNIGLTKVLVYLFDRFPYSFYLEFSPSQLRKSMKPRSCTRSQSTTSRKARLVNCRLAFPCAVVAWFYGARAPILGVGQLAFGIERVTRESAEERSESVSSPVVC